MRNFLLAVVAVGFFAGPPAAAQDVDAGKKIFNRCKACHTVDKVKNRGGPHLIGLFGRTAGTVDGFKYSKAMKKAGEEGLVWNEETVEAYIRRPKEFVKGTKMQFPGLKKTKDRKNIIAYLKEATAQ